MRTCKELLLLAALFFFPVLSHAADNYFYRGNYYASLSAAEAAMRAYNSPWGADLVRCDTRLTSNSSATIDYCTQKKPVIYWRGGYWVGWYGFSCDPQGVPPPNVVSPGNGCFTTTEAAMVTLLEQHFYQTYSGYCDLQTEVVGGYVEPLSYWSKQQYYENNTFMFNYVVGDYIDQNTIRKFVYRWRVCSTPGGPLSENYVAIHKITAHLCPNGYQPEESSEATKPHWPSICKAGIDRIYKVAKVNNGTCPITGYPCVPATGDKVLFEEDFEWGSYTFTRIYRSLSDFPVSVSLGDAWTHIWGEHIDLAASSSTAVFMWDGRNDYEEFKPVVGSSAEFRSNKDPGRTLEKQPDNTWILSAGSGVSHIYDSKGKLLSIQDEDSPARTLSFEYNPGGQLISVSNGLGRSLVFVYRAGAYSDPQAGTGWQPSRLVRVEDAAGQVYVSYLYDTASRLASAIYPGGLSRIYHYGEANHLCTGAVSGCAPTDFSGFITGITAEDDVRLSDYYYDAAGRVVRSVHANGAFDTTLSYISGTQTQVTRPGYGTEMYNFDGSLYRRPLSVQSSDGTKTWQYDAVGAWRRTTDKNGVSALSEYDSRGLEVSRMEAETLAETRRTITTWTDGPLPRKASIEVRNSSGQAVSRVGFTYNNRGQTQTATRTDPSTSAIRTTTSTYCEQTDITNGTCPLLGLVTSINGPRTDVADTTTYTYYASDDASCVSSPTTCPHRKGDLWKVADALGRIIETLAYDGAGRVLSVKDANNVVTDFTYHPRGWLTARKVRGTNNASETDDQITAIEYWPTGLVKKVIQPDGAFTAYTYDAAHRLTDINDNAGNTIRYTLDNAGNRTAEETKDAGNVLRRSLSRVYNQLGQLQTAKDAYNHATGFTYDANGNNQTVTDALNRVADNDYDPLNRLVRTLQDVGGIQAETKFAYDAQDNLTKVTDPKGLDTTYTYNGFGDLTQLSSPDTGVTTYTYDSAGNRKTQTDARSITATYSYDALNRLTGIAYPTSSLDVTYVYDTVNAACIAGETFAIGRLTKMIDGSGNTEYCYDRFGHLTRKRQTTNGQVFELRYAYTKAGQLQAMTYPDGAVVDYVRDGQGRTTEVGVTPSGGTRQILLNQATYYPFGPIAGWTYGNGRTMSRTLNQNYQPLAIEDPNAGGLSLGYEFDEVGNLKKLFNADQSVTKAQYGYDALNRLTDVKDGPTGTVIDHYAYDATGNRTSFTNAGGTTSYTYPSTNHRLINVGGTARTYDNVGNTTQIGGTAKEFVYNDAGRMSQVKVGGTATMNYQLNGRGEQVRKYLNTANTYTVYNEAGQWIGDYDTSGNPIQQAVWLDDLPVGLLAGATTSQKLHYLQPDHLGTPRAVIDTAANTAIWRWDLEGDAFGNTVPNQDPDSNGTVFLLNMRFPGQRADASSGLNYNYRRDYDKSVGRYVQSDPIGLNGGLSTYGYVHQTPLTDLDPLGLFSMYAYQLYSGEWRFRFRFHQSCVLGDSPLDWADRSFQRLPWVGKARKQQVRLERPTGDVDAADKCACREFDQELETIFKANGWQTGDRYGGGAYNQAQASQILMQLRQRVNQLNRNREKDCKSCEMPWDSLIDKAKARGIPYIGNSAY